MKVRAFLALLAVAVILITGTTESSRGLLTDTHSVGSNASNTAAAFVRTKYGSFTKSTAAAPASQSITGLGFQPKAVIFFWTRQTATGFAARQSSGFGFTTGSSNERAVSYDEDDAASTSNSGVRKSASRVILMRNGSTVAQAELTSFDPDGFTINWTANETRADIIHYLALGGDGLTNTVASSFELTSSGGNQAVTGVGFRPDMVLFLTGGDGPIDFDFDKARLVLGMATGPTEQAALVVASQDDNSANTNKVSQQRTDAVILLTTDSGTQNAVADLVSMDADGFTVNKSDAPSVTETIYFLALRGGQHRVGSFNQPASTGKSTVTGSGFLPRSLMLFSTNKVAGSGIVLSSTLSAGAAHDGPARGSIWAEAKNVDPSDTNSYTSTTDLLTLASSPNSVNARADLFSFDSDGFTLNWSAADSTPRQVLYWALR
jgi:hypothetical protein